MENKFKQILRDSIAYDKEPRDLKEILNNFGILKVPYGSDIKNKEWKQTHNDIEDRWFSYTFFYLSSKFYVVILHKDGWVKFNSIPEDSMKNIETPSVEDFITFSHFDRTNTGNISDVFSAVFYVIMEGTSFFPALTQIYFKGYDAKLQKIYKKFLSNGQALHFLKQYGFEFDCIDEDDNIIFRKIK